MLKAYKTEINLTPEQVKLIHQTLGVCRFIYNFYLAHNKEIYQKEKRFISANDFSKWLNNEFIPNNPEYSWIKDVSSKAVKQSMVNGEKASKNFFKGNSKFPKFKKKKRNNVKAYFPKNNKTDWTIERHKIKIPTFGFVKLKEKGYIPTDKKVISGTISMKAGRYFVSVLVDEKIQNNVVNFHSEGIGIDLGLKDFAICSNGDIKKNINKTSKVKKLEKQLKREQRCLSRKYESKKKGEATKSAKNIDKQVLKVQKLHQKLQNIRQDYINKIVNEMVKTKPKYITIEDLNVKGMMKNKHLSKAVAQQNFFYFKIRLESKCKEYGIELRIVSKWYPSSKTCSCCGNIKKDLKLSDRVYMCEECGLEIDRDYNASVNLMNAKEYIIAC
ncbi:MAG: transposase [Clostridiales bacterium GWB2_37_7]|nr:MAG: transposase [Clostridiales bacterium GWB2_37_7]